MIYDTDNEYRKNKGHEHEANTIATQTKMVPLQPIPYATVHLPVTHHVNLPVTLREIIKWEFSKPKRGMQPVLLHWPKASQGFPREVFLLNSRVNYDVYNTFSWTMQGLKNQDFVRLSLRLSFFLNLKYERFFLPYILRPSSKY